MVVWFSEQADEMALDELSLSPCPRYFWRSHPLNNYSGSDIFSLLFQPQTHRNGVSGIATLLESPIVISPDDRSASSAKQAEKITSERKKAESNKLARYSICAGAPRVVSGQPQLWTPSIGAILPFLQRLSEVVSPVIDCVGETLPPKRLPFLGGWLGWLGYDLAWEIEQLPWLKEDQLPFPVAFWYEPAEFAVLDHQSQCLWLAADSHQGVEALSLELSLKLNAPTESLLKHDRSSIHIDTDHSQAKASFMLETSRSEFHQAVNRAKAHIQAGDVFQVNHSLRFQAQTALSSWTIYKTLHTINPSPFASYWHTPWGAVVSCSPERLVHLDNRIAQSRPIAGTRPRGATPELDEVNAQVLMGDRKEQAEHIMLVDLERNDLGRVCEWGSVQVDELMTIERYSHVMHLVSNVVGRLSADASAANLIAALFPGGTITGCPKIRCMEIIETLEPVRRSLFYGSCGYLDRRGRLDLNILIRTLLVSPVEKTDGDACSKELSTGLSTVWGQVGAGIVADSDPEKEWKESLQKAKAQLLSLGLPEDLTFSE